jgi:hypothetical protein
LIRMLLGSEDAEGPPFFESLSQLMSQWASHAHTFARTMLQLEQLTNALAIVLTIVRN